MNDNNSIDKDMNETLQNGYISSGSVLLNRHTLLQDNEQSKINEMNMSVENGDVNGYYLHMNSYTGSIINNHNSIDYAKKRDGIYTNRR